MARNRTKVWDLNYVTVITSATTKSKGESEPAWLWIFMGFLGALSLCVTGTFALIIFVATASRIRRRLCSRDRRLTGTPAALGL